MIFRDSKGRQVEITSVKNKDGFMTIEEAYYLDKPPGYDSVSEEELGWMSITHGHDLSFRIAESDSDWAYELAAGK